MKHIILLFFIVNFFSSCKQSKPTEKEATATAINNVVKLTTEQFKNAHIETGKPEKLTITGTLTVNGKIDVPPQNLVSVSMPLGGYLLSTNLLPGMPVKKGEVIATLEDQQYIQLQQDYLTVKAKLAFAEKEVERQKELNQTKASSDKVFQSAEAEYKMLQINLNALAEKLKLINIKPAAVAYNTISRSVPIYSPINGFVSKVNVNIGKYVTPADVMFELINTSDIHLNLKVFEKDIDKINVGQKVMAHSNAHPDKKYPCEIILISRDITDDGSVEVHCHFEQYDHTLFPGMYMNATIDIKNQHAFVVPEDAVVTFESKQYIFVSKGNYKYEMTEVNTGINKDGKIAIQVPSANNFENLEIVQKGAYVLLMQLKNKPEED